MKRGSVLRRRQALRARAKLRAKRRKERGDADNEEYLEFVRSLPCCAPNKEEHPCFGRIEAHHRTGAGMGKKARDDETMPLCSLHHSDLHEFTGTFSGWPRDHRSFWQLQQIARTRLIARSRGVHCTHGSTEAP